MCSCSSYVSPCVAAADDEANVQVIKYGMGVIQPSAVDANKGSVKTKECRRQYDISLPYIEYRYAAAMDDLQRSRNAEARTVCTMASTVTITASIPIEGTVYQVQSLVPLRM